MPAVRISFAESAIADLEEIGTWYEEQGVPDVGTRLIAEIFDKIDHLRVHPEMGRVVPEFAQSVLRELIHPPFRVVYRRDKAAVRILRVWRGERLLRIEPAEEAPP